MKQTILKLIFSKLPYVIILILLQLAILMGFVHYFNKSFTYVYALFIFVGILSVLYLINKKEVPEVRIAWIVCVLSLPIFGVALYLLLGEPILNKGFKNKLELIGAKTVNALQQNPSVCSSLKEKAPLISTQSSYIYQSSHCPVFQNTDTKYLELGEIKFEILKQELKKAKRYIFLQYFIIAQGEMWNEILEILKEKVGQGLDVRVMYDDAGCVMTLPYEYDKILRKLGIKCQVINSLTARLDIALQNRDHRKIVVIDGEVGFTGGINLGDEYINKYKKHGHWKDSAVMLRGDAVFSLAVMFLQTWDFFTTDDEDYNCFKPCVNYKAKEQGFVQPYSDSPFDKEYMVKMIYLNILNQAKDYVYINSPYFIVDNEVVNTFIGTAKRGVDIRLVTPHIADKWYVHLITRSHYKELIESGVKVYEYTPGFMHSKTFVSDDVVATVGTVNLDYRSLYHHFECGVWMYETNAVKELKQDYLDTLKVCHEITMNECNKEKWYKELFTVIMKIITPLF